MDQSAGRLSTEQWKRAYALVQSLSSMPVEAALEQLSQSGEDAEVIAGVRQALTRGAEASLWRSGMTLGRYVVGAPLGRGGFGEVYSGRDTLLGRAVALKFLKEPGSSMGRNLLREAQAASGLNHPNIVTVHEVLESASGPVIVMELVEGATLRQVMKAPVPRERAQRYTEQLLEALAAAHANGIVHGDLKPENVIVRPDGYLKVLDFGLAHTPAGDLAHSNPGKIPAGSLRYMSPEQCNGAGATAASDLFAAGLMIAEMAEGKHPFPAETPLEAAVLILRSAPQIKNSGPLSAVATRMLEKDPAARPSAAGALELLRQAEQRRRWRWVFAIASLAAAVAALGMFFEARTRVGPSLIAPVPLTSNPGWEFSSSFSPDSQAVAYAWADGSDSNTAANTRILVKRFDRDSPVSLAMASLDERVGQPAWSPDGRLIAYKFGKKSGAGGVWTVAPDGTGQRKLVDVANSDLSSGIDWAPDGKRIAYTDRAENGKIAVHVYDMETRQHRAITRPPEGAWGDWDPRFSPDGRLVAFKRVLNFNNDYLYVAPAEGGEPKQVTTKHQGIAGHAWIPDGKRLFFSARQGGTPWGLRSVSLDGTAAAQPVPEPSVDDLWAPSFSRRGDKAAWVRRAEDLNIYRVPVAGGAAQLIAGSTAKDTQSSSTLDGRLAFVSRRSGSDEVWMTGPDATNPVRITDVKVAINSIAWSPDGKRFVLGIGQSGRNTLHFMECDGQSCGKPGAAVAEGEYPKWSPDGRWIYYRTLVRDQFQVFRMAASGGEPVRVSPDAAQGWALSHDGAWLYFGPPTVAIRRIRLDSPETKVEDVMTVGDRPGAEWVVLGSEVIFWHQGDAKLRPAIRAFHVESRRLRTIVETSSAEAFEISADGRYLYFSRLDRAGSNILVARWGR